MPWFHGIFVDIIPMHKINVNILYCNHTQIQYSALISNQIFQITKSSVVFSSSIIIVYFSTLVPTTFEGTGLLL